MGLAASQARLLTITSRKARAQFDSMRMSHERLALSRQLTEISNEYQNSLNQTKLYYDFYGVNSTDTPLTYNMLMSPSSINDYTPTLISNNQGRIILSAPYAQAATAAGIPQEGLGCTPSSLMREAFIWGLAGAGIITEATAKAITGIDYNPNAGLGSDNLLNTITSEGTVKDLYEILDDVGNSLYNCGLTNPDVAVIRRTGNTNTFESCTEGGRHQMDWTSSGSFSNGLAGITFKELLTGENHIYLGEQNMHNGIQGGIYAALNGVITTLGETLANTIEGAADAVAYANSQMDTYFWKGHIDPTTGMYAGNPGDVGAYTSHKVGTALGAFGSTVAEVLTLGIYAIFGGDVSDGEVAEDSFGISKDVLVVSNSWGRSGWFHDDPNDQATLDLSAFTQAWFTYFMQYMAGLGSDVSNSLNVAWGEVKTNSHFANEGNVGDLKFIFKTTYVSDNEALISNFYDTLFNQICVNGWNENNQVATDSNYLKEMLQTGMMYLTSISDDNYFYQNNYSTNTFIKEVQDEAAIAAAESRYTTEKARINAKEQELDIKMKNLDTEISSLETEYEAVKKVIDGNVSKSFTRYDS